MGKETKPSGREAKNNRKSEGEAEQGGKAHVGQLASKPDLWGGSGRHLRRGVEQVADGGGSDDDADGAGAVEKLDPADIQRSDLEACSCPGACVEGEIYDSAAEAERSLDLDFLEKAWAELAQGNPPKKWRRVSNPVEAARKALERAGWQSKWATTWLDDLGCEVKLTQTPPRLLHRMMRDALARKKEKPTATCVKEPPAEEGQKEHAPAIGCA